MLLLLYEEEEATKVWEGRKWAGPIFSARTEYLSNEQHNRTELNTEAMENLFISTTISPFSLPLKVQIYKFFLQSLSDFCAIFPLFSFFFTLNPYNFQSAQQLEEESQSSNECCVRSFKFGRMENNKSSPRVNRN